MTRYSRRLLGRMVWQPRLRVCTRTHVATSPLLKLNKDADMRHCLDTLWFCVCVVLCMCGILLTVGTNWISVSDLTDLRRSRLDDSSLSFADEVRPQTHTRPRARVRVRCARAHVYMHLYNHDRGSARMCVHTFTCGCRGQAYLTLS